MPIPLDQLARAAKLLRSMEDRVPLEVRHKVRIAHRVEGNAIVLFEERPRWDKPEEWQESYIAKFLYVQSTNRWKLFREDRNLKWRGYEDLNEAETFERLYREVDEDPLCFFWG